MSALSVMLVLLLPALLGAPLLALLDGSRRGRVGYWAERIAGGWLLGVPLCGAMLRLFVSSPPMALFGASIVWLLVLAGAFWLLWWWRVRRIPASSVPATATFSGWNGLCWLLLILLVTHWLLAALQALWLPTLTWDAWTTWLGKPKAWSGADSLSSFQALQAWSAAGGEGGLTALAPHYPESVPRYLMLLVSAAGGWSSSTSHLPWLLLQPMIGVSVFAGLRRIGCQTWLALLGAYALLSMPLVDAHLSLAGYLDLWIAALLALAALALWRWRQTGERRHLLTCLLFTAALPLLKQEGAVWLLLMLATLVLLVLPSRLRWLLLGLGLLALVVGLLLGGLPIPAPGLGTVWLRWGQITVPGIGDIDLALHPVLPEVFASLFLLPNFHLLWWLLPIGALIAWRQCCFDRGARGLGLLLLFGLCFVGFLFFFTDAAAWAKNLTSLNRIVLQLVPVAILFLVALFSAAGQEPDDRAAPTAR